jgi:hypothetical protein
MAKILASVHLPNVCLFTVMALPRACLFWHPTCPVTLIVYKQVISQLVKYKRVVGTQQVFDLTSKQTLVSSFTWVTFTDLWKTEKWPRQVQALCSHDLPNISKCYICHIYEL